jgi:hypothetical protein
MVEMGGASVELPKEHVDSTNDQTTAALLPSVAMVQSTVLATRTKDTQQHMPDQSQSSLSHAVNDEL